MKIIQKNNNNSPLVSVCIPVYNHELYVIDCIQSIIDQDYKNIELIIIDDGSYDESKKKIEKILTECECRFVRFEFRSRPNKGLCATLNEAIDWCQGEYFCVIASDDIWEKNKTSEQIKIYNDNANHKIGVVTGEVTEITANGVNVRLPTYRPPALTFYSFDDIYSGAARISAPTTMIKMEALMKTGGYNPDIAIEDWFMWLSIAKLDYAIIATNQYFAKYRSHENNTYKKIRKMYVSQIKIDEIFARNPNELLTAYKRTSKNAFAAAAIYDKKFAIELLIKKRINPLKREFILSIIFLMLPKFIIHYLVKTKRFISSF